MVGLDDDGTSVVCEGHAGSFTVPIDDTLRAAVRGDLRRTSAAAGDGEAELRPREIQARIRAGATVEEVAALTGVKADKITRFANPVLLERARAAEMAALAHPVRGDGPMSLKLAEVVDTALADRGHPETTEWDAWKTPDNRWTVRIAWTVGKSRNEAHFTFVPGTHGGTASPLDQTAKELLDPDARRALRSIAPALPADPTVPTEPLEDESQAVSERDGARPRQAPRRGSALSSPQHDGHGGRVDVPSWEDVLLGVRSAGRN